jgi:hypothetical protein
LSKDALQEVNLPKRRFSGLSTFIQFNFILPYSEWSSETAHRSSPSNTEDEISSNEQRSACPESKHPETKRKKKSHLWKNYASTLRHVESPECRMNSEMTQNDIKDCNNDF